MEGAPPPREQPLWRRCLGCFHWDFVKTPLGIIKIVEFFVVLLALTIIGSVGNIVTGLSSIEFFIFDMTVTWVFIMIEIFLHSCNCFHRLPNIVLSNMVQTATHSLGCFLAMCASAAMMSKWNQHDTIVAGGAFGLIAMFLLAFESVYFFIKWRKDGGGANSYSGDPNATASPTHDAIVPSDIGSPQVTVGVSY